MLWESSDTQISKISSDVILVEDRIPYGLTLKDLLKLMMGVLVLEFNSYPIKSCVGTSHFSVEIGPGGYRVIVEWMVANAGDRCFSVSAYRSPH